MSDAIETLASIRHSADIITEHNFADQRLYLLRDIERLRATLTAYEAATIDEAKDAAQADYEGRGAVKYAHPVPPEAAKGGGVVETRNDEAGFVEFINDDVPVIVRDLDGPAAILIDLNTRKIVGYRIYEPSAGSGEREAPSGYVLVPAEPTEEMLAAGMDSLAESTGEPLSFIVRDVLFAYRAMLAKVKPLTEKHEAEARAAYRAKVDAGWSEET